ncbi:MAG: hypothetical protein JST85_27100 [Acidobacteria bacterium]|nr:hypothetical protein [Acidobacteriota bacterium]
MPKSSELNRIVTPRPYLSWSQMNLFERDPNAYIAQYFNGAVGQVSTAMAFGKRIAGGLEARSTDDAEVERLRTFLPRFPKKEYEIKVAYSGVPLLAKPDMFNPWKVRIGELKTGKFPWTQDRVNQHGQLKFYALATWLKYKRLPKVELYWAPTEWHENKLRLTGEIQTFQAEISEQDILSFGVRITNVWEAIQNASREHYAKSQIIG